jgi:hypothetical protein
MIPANEINVNISYDFKYEDEIAEFWAILKFKGMTDIRALSLQSFEEAEERAIIYFKKYLSIPKPKEITITI